LLFAYLFAEGGRYAMSSMNILVTGGRLYWLPYYNHDVIIVDNFSNSSPEAIKHFDEITVRDIRFCEGDARDKALFRKSF
jgi:UDP-glucose 4-epimerase